MKFVNMLNVKLDMFKLNNKDNRATSLEVFPVLLLLTLNIAKHPADQSGVNLLDRISSH